MRGPKTVPCGTPDITDVALDDSPSTITLWCLLGGDPSPIRIHLGHLYHYLPLLCKHH